jgi:hypothetical protein
MAMRISACCCALRLAPILAALWHVPKHTASISFPPVLSDRGRAASRRRGPICRGAPAPASLAIALRTPPRHCLRYLYCFPFPDCCRRGGASENVVAELSPQLVTFNGDTFDLPVLRYRATRKARGHRRC